MCGVFDVEFALPDNMSAEPDLVTAVATIAATLVSVLAVFVAARSASAAKASADVAAKVLHRSAVRELVAECHELIAEELRIQSLAIDLQNEYTSLFIFGGSSGGSREKMHKGLLEKDLIAASEHTKEAKSLIDSQTKLLTAADNDLDLMQGRIEAERAKLQTIREAMSRQLENTRSQNQLYREKITA